MDQALDILPADYWRWWLLSNAPESSDAEFTWEGFQSSINKDLADVLGNFVSRITKFCRSKFGEEVPPGGTPGEAEAALETLLQERLDNYVHFMETMEVRKSAQELRAIWAAGNEYLQSVAPWKTIKTDQSTAAMQTRIGLNLAVTYAILSSPFLPDASRQILKSFPTARDEWPETAANALHQLHAGDTYEVPEVLFAKVSDEDSAAWKDRFKGVRAS